MCKALIITFPRCCWLWDNHDGFTCFRGYHNCGPLGRCQGQLKRYEWGSLRGQRQR